MRSIIGQGGFSGTVGPDDCRNLGAPQFEANVIENLPLSQRQA
jgi:hypothetical protein